MACVLGISSEICYFRGDTKAIRIKVEVLDTNASPNLLVPLDITGYTFIMTVNSNEDPISASPVPGQLLSMGGIIGSPTNAGIVDFFPSLAESNALPAPEELYYDIQMIDLGGIIRTIGKGIFTTIMDITKS